MKKEKISITLDAKIIKKLRQEVEKGKYANLSFAIEFLCRKSIDKKL